MSTFPKGAVFIIADASMPPIMSSELASNPDLREGMDYVLDLRTAETSFDIVYEISRIAALIHLDDHRESDNLRIIHLSYATGLLESERPATQPAKRKLVDTDKPIRTFLDLGKAVGLLAPTSLSITSERAETTRNSAVLVLVHHLEVLREVGLLV